MINDLGFEIDYDICENKENKNEVLRVNWFIIIERVILVV